MSTPYIEISDSEPERPAQAPAPVQAPVEPQAFVPGPDSPPQAPVLPPVQPRLNNVYDLLHQHPDGRYRTRLPVPPMPQNAQVETDSDSASDTDASDEADPLDLHKAAEEALSKVQRAAARRKLARLRYTGQFEGTVYGKGKRADPRGDPVRPFKVDLTCSKRVGSSACLTEEQFKVIRDRTYEWLADVARQFMPATEWSGYLATVKPCPVWQAAVDLKRKRDEWQSTPEYNSE